MCSCVRPERECVYVRYKKEERMFVRDKRECVRETESVHERQERESEREIERERDRERERVRMIARQ